MIFYSKSCATENLEYSPVSWGVNCKTKMDGRVDEIVRVRKILAVCSLFPNGK